MAIKYFNTDEVEEIAKELYQYVNDFEHEINSLFMRFSEVPTVTGEWVGEKSNYYFNRIALDKKIYVEFASKLRNLSNELKLDASEVRNCIVRNKYEGTDFYE